MPPRTSPPIKLPDSVWRLKEAGKTELIRNYLLEDLYLWNRYELGSTLVGPEVRQSAAFGELPLSERARGGLEVFTQLYPEWMASKPYMSIKQSARQARIERIFGDNPLVLEPRLEELPPNLYQLFEREIERGNAPLLRGDSVDLILLKLPHSLPNSVLTDFFNRLLRLWRSTVPPGKELRLSGYGGRSSQLRHELAIVGKYRLFEANAFDIDRTLEAAHGLDRRIHRGDAFYRAKTHIDRLKPMRWQLAEGELVTLI